MMLSALKRLRASAATLVLLSVPIFAICSLIRAGSGSLPDVVLSSADDPIRNGLRIVEPPVTAAQAGALPRHVDAAAEVVVNDWTFTDKGKPSPYQ
jgi:hypothetical protein